MKNIIVILIILSVGGFAFSQDIVGSSHDLSTGGPTAQRSDQTRVCVFCHTPHNGSEKVLWNRNNPVATDFTNHAGGGTLGEGSLMCLSCHDGATAVNNLVDGTAASFTAVYGSGVIDNDGSGNPVLVGGGDFGVDLANDHPIGMVYPVDNTVGFNNDETFDGIAGHAKLVSGNKVACASCHDPHNMQYGAFMIADNAGSALCLDCHDK